jgi:hypothetical protein
MLETITPAKALQIILARKYPRAARVCAIDGHEWFYNNHPEYPESITKPQSKKVDKELYKQARDASERLTDAIKSRAIRLRGRLYRGGMLDESEPPIMIDPEEQRACELDISSKSSDFHSDLLSTRTLFA